MLRYRRGSRSWACSALLFALVALSLAPGPARAATDDQNLTGLVYLADGTPLSATPWADNTSFAVYVNHTGDWATAWRYPASGWYLTSGGAYSIVLPAAEKDASWSDGDPYHVAFDVSAIAGTPRIENATSHGTGDPGEFPPIGATDNAIVWNATDNWQRWDVVVLALPDFAVLPGDMTATPATVQVGQVVSLSATVRNLGNVSADAALDLFEDADSDGFPDPGEVFDTRPVSLGPGETTNVARGWVAAGVGAHTLCAYVDAADIVGESDEGNNGDCASVLVQPPPETRPDYVPAAPLPPTPVRVGLSQMVSFSLQLRNDGNATAPTTATLAFFNESTPGTPFATIPVPPLSPSEASARFTASWTSPTIPGTVRVIADVDSAGDLVEWDEANNRFAWTIDVLAGPVTNLVVGSPNVTSAERYVTSATPLSFTVLDQGGAGIRNTTYRVDGGPWVNYTAAGPFTLAGEGSHLVDWSSEDFAGNVEPLANAKLVVDDTPPPAYIDVGEPKHAGTDLFVTSSTPFSLTASDGGVDPVGVATIEYRWDGGAWIPFGGPFTVGGPDGPVAVESRATDLLGNAGGDAMAVVLDDTPPVTAPSHGDGSYPAGKAFGLAAMDAGSGVASTTYAIDGGAPAAYAGPFTLPEGDHVIRFRSTDRLNNSEAERTWSVTIEGAPPPVAEPNWKPPVAAVFAAILAVVGVWSARRVPESMGSRPRVRAFLVTALPFVALEAATGVASLLTGWLSIPPILGVGTVVDVGILVAGVAVLVRRVRRWTPPK